VCYAIDGATSWRYEVDVADAGMFLVAEVTARNALGSAVRYSASSSEVAGLPVPLNPPWISGSPIVGSTLTSYRGYWSEEPTSYDYQWLSCAEESEASSTFPETCYPLMFETDYSYTVQEWDEGAYLVLAVTAYNDYGSGVTYSASTSIVGYGLLISGYLTAADNGEPVTFTSLYFQNPEDWTLNGWAYTDEFGYFEATMVPGDYRISVQTQDETLVEGPLPVGIWEIAEVYSLTEDSELSLSVERAGTIAGAFVSSIDGDLVVEGGEANLYRRIPDGSWINVASASADDVENPGQFELDRIAPGTYKLFIGQFWPEPDYVMSWLGGADNPDAATPILVAAGQVTELPALTLVPNPGRHSGVAPVITKTVLPSGELRFNWTKPSSASTILGYKTSSGCSGWGDGSSPNMGADSREVTLPSVYGFSGACSFTVTPFTSNGDTFGKTLRWSEGTTVVGPALSVSNITPTSFSVTAQALTDDGYGYGFSFDFDPSSVTSDSQFPRECGNWDQREPCTVEVTGLKPGKTYTVYSRNFYGDDYVDSGWSTITVTLPLAVARSQIPARR
jgi:hypothetical protein